MWVEATPPNLVDLAREAARTRGWNRISQQETVLRPLRGPARAQRDWTSVHEHRPKLHKTNGRVFPSRV